MSAAAGCVKTTTPDGKKVVEFLGIAVAAAFVLVLVVVNVHNLAGPSSTSQTDNPRTPSDDLDLEVASVSGAMYAGDGLDSWPVGQWKGEIMTPPPYAEADPAPPAPSPPPYELFTLPRVDV